MRLSNKEVLRRKNAVLEFFKKNPQAVGNEVNDLLAKGELTGKKEPVINIKTIYELRKEARRHLAEQALPPKLPESEAMAARRLAPMAVQGATRPLSSAATKAVNVLVAEMKKRPELSDISILRDGTVTIGRQARQEERLTVPV